jgi:tRNA A-37 threonylcarbamoyl transferase component Bud32
VSDALPFAGLSVVKKFPSRKNAVYLVERGGWRLVLKIYDSDRWKNEAEALVEARKAGIAVPGVVETKEKALLMEFIPGRPVNDYLETGRMREAVLGVADWLASFHKAFRSGGEVRLKSDAIFKNFIVSDRVYGLDLELSRMGRPEEDVGEALAYLLDTDPMFTEEKFGLGSEFIGRYESGSGIRLDDIDAYVARALEEAAAFRPDQRDIMLKKAGEIKASRPFRRDRR